MKTTIQIKSMYGSVLFEHEAENNSIKNTLQAAIKSCADLRDADLRGAKTDERTEFFEQQCPSEGSFIAWKKAENRIIKLMVLEDAKRSSATTLKCRCSAALVLEIQDIEGNKLEIKEIRSNHDNSFVYKVGKIASVDNFDENRWNECSAGIHFFMSRNTAVNYNN